MAGTISWKTFLFISQGEGILAAMAEKAKAAREVDKEELLISIEEANDALDSASKNLLRSNVLRTLQTRKKSLSASFDQWNRSCREYSSKVFSSATLEEVKGP